MTNEVKIKRLRIIQSRIPIHNRDEFWDFEALEAAIEAIKTVGEMESRLRNALKELAEERLNSNRLMAVSGMSVEELTDAFTKGYRLVSPDSSPRKKNEQIPDTNSVLEDIKAELKEWYWQADKQAIAKDPCVVDAMIDLFIRQIDAHISSDPQGRSEKE